MKISISKFIFVACSVIISSKSIFVTCSATIPSAMLLDRVQAYTCENRSFCDKILDADLVLQGVVVEKSDQADINDDITYTVLGTVIKPEGPNLIYSERFTFTTAGSSGLCGVDLDLQERYLLGLYRDENFDLRANSCGLVEAFDIGTDNIELNKCLQENCGFGCGVTQECTLDPLFNEMYCANMCKGVICCKGEECTIAPQLCRGPISACPPPAVCVPKKENAKSVPSESRYISDTINNGCRVKQAF